MVYHPSVVFQSHQLNDIPHHKHLGIIIKSDLNWTNHINHVVVEASMQFTIMKYLQYWLDRETMAVVYKSLIRPILEYGKVIWDGCAQADENQLEELQLTAMCIATGAMQTTYIAKLYEETG